MNGQPGQRLSEEGEAGMHVTVYVLSLAQLTASPPNQSVPHHAGESEPRLATKGG